MSSGAWRRSCRTTGSGSTGTRCIFSKPSSTPGGFGARVIAPPIGSCWAARRAGARTPPPNGPPDPSKRSSAIRCCRSFVSGSPRTNMAATIPRIDVTLQELHALLEQLRPRLSDQEYEQLTAVIDTLGYVAELLDDQTTTLARLRALLLGTPGTEKTRDVLAHAGVETTVNPPSDADPSSSAPDHSPRGRARGHG